jgi:hypothetical protein
MPTRSGQKYLKTKLCKCGNFYTHPKFKYKCSSCYKSVIDGKDYTIDGYIQKCNEWANKNCLKEDHGFLKHLKQISKMKNDNILYKISRIILKKAKKFLFAEDALKMYHDNPTNLRAHIVGSIVGDWWNINSKKTTWPSFVSCYYGNYNELPSPCSRIPSRLPNKILVCDNTSNLL